MVIILFFLNLGHGFSPKPPDINGIQITFKHLLRNEFIESEARFGDRALDGSKEFDIEDHEHIVQVNMRSGWIVDSISFVLNTGRVISVGGTGGSYRSFDLKDSVVVGFYGTYGTNLYSLGLHSISAHENKLNNSLRKRFTMILIKQRLLHKREELENKIKELEMNKEDYSSEIAIGKLCLMSKIVFASVTLFTC
jgi:hypothetical protein